MISKYAKSPLVSLHIWGPGPLGLTGPSDRVADACGLQGFSPEGQALPLSTGPLLIHPPASDHPALPDTHGITKASRVCVP